MPTARRQKRSRGLLRYRGLENRWFSEPYTVYAVYGRNRELPQKRGRRRRRHNDGATAIVSPPHPPNADRPPALRGGGLSGDSLCTVRRVGRGKYWSAGSGPPAARSIAGRRRQTLYRSRGNHYYSTGVARPAVFFFPPVFSPVRPRPVRVVAR